MTSTVIVTLAGAVAAGFGSAGFWAWLQARRTASGQVSTTPAEVLWQQAQAMLTSLGAERDKAVDQRDKLLGTVAAIAPTLASIDSSLRTLLEVSASASTTPEP